MHESRKEENEAHWTMTMIARRNCKRFPSKLGGYASYDIMNINRCSSNGISNRIKWIGVIPSDYNCQANCLFEAICVAREVITMQIALYLENF